MLNHLYALIAITQLAIAPNSRSNPSKIIKSYVHRHAMIAMYAVINFNYDHRVPVGTGRTMI